MIQRIQEAGLCVVLNGACPSITRPCLELDMPLVDAWLSSRDRVVEKMRKARFQADKLSKQIVIIKCARTETAAIRRKVGAAKAAEQEASARALVAEFVLGAFE